MKRWHERGEANSAANRRPAAVRHARTSAALLLALFVLPCLLLTATPSSAYASARTPTPDSQVAPPPATPTQVSTPESSWWTYLTEDYPVLGGLLLIFALTVSVGILLSVLPWVIQFARDMGLFKRSASNSEMMKKSSASNKAKAGGDLYALLGADTSVQAKRAARATAGTTEKKDYSKFRSQAQTYQPAATAQGGEQTGTERGESGKQPAPRAEAAAKGAADKSEGAKARPAATASQPSVWGGPSAEKALSLLREDLERLRADLTSRMEEVQRELRDTSDKVAREVAWEVVPELAGLLIKQKLDKAQSAAPARASEDEARLLGEHLEKEMNVLHQHLANEVKVMRAGLDRLEERQASLDKTQQHTREEMAEEAARAIEKLSAEVAEIRSDMVAFQVDHLTDGGQSEVPDSFYARTLGTILGQNVEALRDGNFEELSRQVCERLNQFFQFEVPHGDKLQALRARAEAVSDAMADVFAQVQKLKPEAAEEAAPHLGRAAALATELAALQSQLQTRRATVETTLRVPVSLHAGARQSFLDELGRGIRREVDKLSDPQSHFAGELKRLTTDAVIPLVDVCDKKVAPPGTWPELEAALNHLSAQAELLPILPRPGDAFRPAEQEMLRLVQGAPGKSMCVAQVFTRGFYHTQPDGKTLLRKAGVAVYR